MKPYEDHIGLWGGELSGWVPERIFDVHVHLGPEGVIGGFSPERLREPLSTFTHLTWEELSAFYGSLYGGREIAGLAAFGIPVKEANLELANRYIAELSASEPKIRGFIISDPADTGRTVEQFRAAERRGSRFCGVKPYFDLLGKSNYECRMEEFIPDDLLGFMESEGLVMMLHTSGLGMGAREDQDFVRGAAERYPGVKIILAHMGRYLAPEQFFDFLESDVLDYPQIYLDMSSASSVEVYRAALSRSDLRRRLLFGSDAPFGLITGTECSDLEGAPPGMFLTRDDYTWSDAGLNARFAAQRGRMTYNTYHVIKAFKDAIEGLGLGAEELDGLKRDIFCGNAERLFCRGGEK